MPSRWLVFLPFLTFALPVRGAETSAVEIPAGELPAREGQSGEVPAREVPAAEAAATELPAREVPAGETEAVVTPVTSTLELQVELHRRGFSCGSIDGIVGAQTAAALRAFQRSVGIPVTGTLDAATREQLSLSGPAVRSHTVTPLEIGALHPVPTTWLGKSEVENLGYATLLELLAERYHAHPNLIRRLNPGMTAWDAPYPGVEVVVPAVDEVRVAGRATQLVITLAGRELDVCEAGGRIIAHFPVSIARAAEKRPVGELHVTVVIPDPDYTFNPEVFPESAEARTLGRKLILPPGPNNPVGRAWIGLDRPGYGIHGTPDPEKVGRTESHGCFRLANWDAVTLLRLVQVGMPVLVVQ